MQIMAAKPPSKPPGNFLKQLNDCFASGNNTTTKIFQKISTHLKKSETENNNNSANNSGSSCSGSNNSLASLSNINGNINDTDVDTTNLLAACAATNISTTPKTTSTAAASTASTVAVNKSSCNCTNISIMHLFHEMKQEFPTIPDTIVTKCVNENCHQRENCIQQLRHELALHAVPMQTYPAKALHPTTPQQKRAKAAAAAAVVDVEAPSTPLRPTRPAPLQPPQQQQPNCDSDNKNCRNNSGSAKNTSFMQKDVDYSKQRWPTSDMPVTSNNDGIYSCISSYNSGSNNNNGNNNSEYNNKNNNSGAGETQSNDNCVNVNQNELETKRQQLLTPQPVQPPPPTIPPRTRPTTLNLQQQQQRKHNQQQQQQPISRQQINQQLQNHFQQRQPQQRQQQLQKAKTPLRKAPLPPLPPKPAHYGNAASCSPQFQHQYSNPTTNNNNSSSNHVYVSSQRSSFSNDSNLTSPTSSVGESEISVSVSLSPLNTTPPPLTQQQQQQKLAVNAALRSPIRHRSVITVHPEPPYTRDFLNASSSSTASSPTTTASVSSSSGVGCIGNGKSFTSVNLTLRQPNANAAVPASTIDISAGPGLSNNSSGLTYSSTSYDARLGFQKNFHITVTDEGGVFSASRIRPRSCFVPEAAIHENDLPNSPTAASTAAINQANPLRAATSEQCVAMQQQMQRQQQQQHFLNALHKNAIATSTADKATIEILERQKSRRDKLANALRDNKKRLSQVYQEINMLADPIRPGENERLDEEIRNLSCECEALLNEIDITKRGGRSLPNRPSTTTPTSSIQQHQQQQPQPFQRQRSQRTTPTINTPTYGQLSQLDFIQHNNSPIATIAADTAASTNTTPATTSPRTPLISSPHHKQQQPLQQQQAPPPPYQDCYQFHNHRSHHQQQQQRLINSTDDDEENSDSITDANENDDDYEEDEEEEPLETWACNMCTFRNHPQLNICECCENVRIPPEPILSREDIHITLSPGENRIIHSWILS